MKRTIRAGSSTGTTSHEHLDPVGLIHMSGRVYDPVIGRFVSADPFIQAPYDSQSYNRYAYVMNNPLSFTDPSGYMVCYDITSSGTNSGSAQTECFGGDQLPLNSTVITDPAAINQFIGNLENELNPQSQAVTGYGIMVADAGDAALRGMQIADMPYDEAKALVYKDAKLGMNVIEGGIVVLSVGEGLVLIKSAKGLYTLYKNGKLTGYTFKSIGEALSKITRGTQLGQGLKNVREITSGRLKGFNRGNTELPGGTQGAKDLFKQLTGNNPKGEFDRIVLDDGREVLFRSASTSGPSKIEVVNPNIKFLEKISFPE